MVLDILFDPIFSQFSHGFRRGRGCHSAFQQIKDHWIGTSWLLVFNIRKWSGWVQVCERSEHKPRSNLAVPTQFVGNGINVITESKQGQLLAAALRGRASHPRLFDIFHTMFNTGSPVIRWVTKSLVRPSGRDLRSAPSSCFTLSAATSFSRDPQTQLVCLPTSDEAPTPASFCDGILGNIYLHLLDEQVERIKNYYNRKKQRRINDKYKRAVRIYCSGSYSKGQPQAPTLAALAPA